MQHIAKVSLCCKVISSFVIFALFRHYLSWSICVPNAKFRASVIPEIQGVPINRKHKDTTMQQHGRNGKWKLFLINLSRANIKLPVIISCRAQPRILSGSEPCLYTRMFTCDKLSSVCWTIVLLNIWRSVSILAVNSCCWTSRSSVSGWLLDDGGAVGRLARLSRNDSWMTQAASEASSLIEHLSSSVSCVVCRCSCA